PVLRWSQELVGAKFRGPKDTNPKRQRGPSLTLRVSVCKHDNLAKFFGLGAEEIAADYVATSGRDGGPPAIRRDCLADRLRVSVAHAHHDHGGVAGLRYRPAALELGRLDLELRVGVILVIANRLVCRREVGWNARVDLVGLDAARVAPPFQRVLGSP